MKNILLTALLCVCMAPPVCAAAHTRGFSDTPPEVQYLRPRDNAEIDTTGGGPIVFKWRLTPIPSGWRRYYEIRVFKGFTEEVVAKELLDRNASSFEIDSATFMRGQLYTWQVRQRDQGGMWSRPRRWKFTIKE
ncbi:MAG: hypothetical protein JW844_06070 [Candidatus Omnitrophica bacterium]|nr:hypothetical protein [Candidatus Omnitrophota bacterium]